MRDSKSAKRLQAKPKAKPKSKAQAAPKKKSWTQLKHKADEWFSKYIRGKYADDDGMVSCFTCGRQHHALDMHSGHFASRRHLATRWDEDNVRPQCKSCNIFNQGQQWLFGKGLDREQPGRAEEVMRRAEQRRKFTSHELDELARRYRNAWQEMASHKRLVQRDSNPGLPVEDGTGGTDTVV